ERLALERDRVGQGQPQVGQRVPAAGVGVAPQQRFVACVEEHQLRLQPHRAHRRQPFGELGQVAAVAHVDAHRELLLGALGVGGGAHELRQQFRRQVVHAVEAQVLEGVEGHALAAAGHAGDDQQRGGRAAVPGRGWNRIGHGSAGSSPLSRKWEWRARKAAAGSMPFERRIWVRVAASVSTARLRPGMTGSVIIGTSRSSTRRWPRSPVSRTMPSSCSAGSASGLARCTIRRRYLFRLTAVAPNIWRMLSTPRPRSSSRSWSRSGQVPSSTSGAIWVNSGASSATRRWPRVISSSASSLLPDPASPVISTPIEYTSMNTPCRVPRGAGERAMGYCRWLSSAWPRRGEPHSGVWVSSAAARRSSGQAWFLLITSASGRYWITRSMVSQRSRGSRPSSQASSSLPRICTLLG